MKPNKYLVFAIASLFGIFGVAGCKTGVIVPDAVRCANNWKTQGYDFDPNSMNCSQMFYRVQAIRGADYWREKGYYFNPNSMTKDQMDLKVKDIDRARYWKKNKGYDFDPNSMTVRQMDQKAEELDTIAYWKKAGYYYDPNTQTVFLTAQKKTELKSLASFHDVGKIVHGVRSSYSPPSRSSPSGRWQICDTTSIIDSRDNTEKQYCGTVFKSRQNNSINPKQQFYFSAPYSTMATQSPSVSPSLGALGINKYHPDSLANPYGAGSPYKPDGLMNPYSQYGSPYSNKSWRSPYATDAPKLYDSDGNYRGKLSANRYDPDSTSNPYGRYGSKFSPDSINNPFGAGNPYLYEPIYVVPSTK